MKLRAWAERVEEYSYDEDSGVVTSDGTVVADGSDDDVTVYNNGKTVVTGSVMKVMEDGDVDVLAVDGTLHYEVHGKPVTNDGEFVIYPNDAWPLVDQTTTVKFK